MYSGDRQIVNLGPAGPLRDYRSPELAGKNAGMQYQQIANFLDNLIKVGKPVYDAYVGNQVAEEKAKIMAQPEMLDAYRRGDDEAKAFIASMRPQTRDFINQTTASAALEQYKGMYSTLIARDPILTAAPPDGADEEATSQVRVLRLHELQQQAGSTAGLDNLDPVWLGTIAPQLQQINAAGRAFVYQKQSEAIDKADDDSASQSFGTNLFSLNEARRGALNTNRYEDYAKELDNWWSQTSTQWQESRVPQRILELTWRGFTGKYNELLAGGELADVDAAEQLLATMTSLSESQVKFKNGQTLGAMTFEDGTTLASKLAELRLKIRPMRDKLEEEQQFKSIMPLIQQALQPGAADAVRAQAAAQLPLVFDDPRSLMQAASLINQASSIADQPTEPQRQTMALLQMELNKEGLSYEQKKDMVLSAPGLTWEQRLAFSRQVVEEPNQEARSIASARQYNSLEIQQAGESISQAIATAKAQGRLNPGVAIPDADTASRDAAIAATRMTEQRIAQMRADGKAPSSDEMAAIYRNELDAYTRSQMQQAGAARREKPATFAQVVTEELDFVRQRLQGNGGQPTIEVFPQAVRERAAQQGYPQTYLGVQRYFLNRMKSATEDDGKGGQRQVFADPAKTYRDTIRSVRGANESQLAPTQGSGGNLLQPILNAVPGLGLQVPALQWLQQKVLPSLSPQSAAPKPQGNSSSQATAAKPQSNVGEQLIGGALNLLVGATPASAQEFSAAKGGMPGIGGPDLKQSPIVGVENIPILSELMKLHRRATQQLRINTPVLPQTAAGVPVKPAPLAITTDTHPLFVAIGINEGTRTPNGGYTKAYYGHRDPGNGAWNLGTVSGQQGGSPQSSDQRWAGILTQTAISVAPILARVGLPQNTAGFQRILFNVLDLKVQAPAAVPDFLKRLPQIVRQGVTIEAIAKARADSFINPATGKLEAAGFGNNYQTLLRDQRSRAGTWDYKRRL